ARVDELVVAGLIEHHDGNVELADIDSIRQVSAYWHAEREGSVRVDLYGAGRVCQAGAVRHYVVSRREFQSGSRHRVGRNTLIRSGNRCWIGRLDRIYRTDCGNRCGRR